MKDKTIIKDETIYRIKNGDISWDIPDNVNNHNVPSSVKCVLEPHKEQWVVGCSGRVILTPHKAGGDKKPLVNFFPI